MEDPAFQIPRIFSLTPLKPDSIPSDETFIGDGNALLDASASWQAGKVHRGIKTFQHRQRTEEAGSSTTHMWYALVSVLLKEEISFKKLWSRMGNINMCEQKSQGSGKASYISQVTRLKYISESQSIWTVSCTYPPPFSPRVYTVLKASWLLEHSHNRRGIIITIPIDLSSKSTRNLAALEERGARGRYVSIEHIQEKEGDIIEWRKVACLDPGGFIPKFLAQKSTLKKLIKENIECLRVAKNSTEDDTAQSQSERRGFAVKQR